MTTKEFIQYKLDELKSNNINKPLLEKDLLAFIFQVITTKKFRKFSLTQEYSDHIKEVIQNSTANNLPIKFSFPFGGYKLWRLEESPGVDWAELFTLMYYSKWLKPIAEVYEPGVIFDFASDDIIVEKMNNIPKEETEKYRSGFNNLIEFIKNYIPNNLKFTFTPIATLYTEEEFELDLKDKKEEFGGLPILNDRQRQMTELNVKLKPEQENDPLWREKTELIHQAYYAVDKRRPYNKANDKIVVFPYTLKDGRCVAVGTTKTSVAKFWVGIGILKKINDTYIEYILSPSQIKNSNLKKEDISIEGLNEKNFKNIKILN
jgi:pyoverdine/dityrosine biosynthesis protein Dit1